MSTRLMIGVFTREKDLLNATRATRAADYAVADAYTPYAVHGMGSALGLKASRLTWVCFVGGLVGALSMGWFEFWTSAVDWPINVGGKPFQSLPAFFPILFEFTILLAGLGVVAALFLRCGLRPGKAARLVAPGVTDDRFVLVVHPGIQDPSHLRWLLEHHGAIEVKESLEEER